MTDLAPGFDLDDAAVAHVLAQHRPGLTAHCYRMLGSAFDARDALQETFIRAWQGIDRLEGRAALPSWLYRIATNVCLDMLAGPGEPARLTPIPDRLVLAPDTDPAASVVARDSIRLAFVAALQHLQPQPRAVLALHDVLRWHADEVAEVLDTTVTAVHSMLRQARQTMSERDAGRDSGAGSGESEWGVVARYVDAFQRFDVEALVALLRDDVILSIPPVPGWLRGSGSRVRLTRANGVHAVGGYRPGPDGDHHAFGLSVLEIAGGQITALHAFLEPRLFPLFDLPERLPRDAPGR